MTTGTIKFFNPSKGFGFVTPDGGGPDIFLPAATLAASGVAITNPGQRVAFEQAPDKKGPKVVALQLLAEPIVKTPAPAPEQVKVYCDPTSDVGADVLSTVRSAGYQLQLLDYVTTPLGQDELRRLSQLLSDTGKSLVRRHDPLFSALQLDDRFIGDQEFWMAVAEHPSLINGPVLLFSGKARICKSPDDVLLFLGKSGGPIASKRKTLSPRIAALIRGEPLATLPNLDAIALPLASQPSNISKIAKPVSGAPVKLKRKLAAKPRAAKAVKTKTSIKRKPSKKAKA